MDGGNRGPIGGFGLFSTAINAAIALVRVFYAVLLANPFALLIAAVAAVALFLALRFGSSLWDDIVSAWNAGAAKLDSVWDRVKSAASSTGDFIAKVFKDSLSGIGSFFKSVIGFFDRLLDKAAAVGRAIKGVGGTQDTAASGGGGSGFARGGAVRGPGTGTSNSISAWLSNGEFVVRAAAVRRLGLSSMNALNRGHAPGFSIGDSSMGSRRR